MASLILRGDINNVLFSQVNENNLIRTSTTETGFSFGLGAILNDGKYDWDGLGEFLSTPELAAVLPADGVFRAKFALSRSEFVTPFNVALPGIDNEILKHADNNDEKPINLTEFWKLLFVSQKSNNDAVLIGMVALAKIQDLKSAFVIQPPIESNKPVENIPISDPSVYSSWFKVNENNYKGHWALIVGVGLNTEKADVLDGKEEGIFYLHPSSLPDSGILVHQHIVVLDKDIPRLDRGLTTGSLYSKIENKKFQNIQHVLDNSSFSELIFSYRQYDNIEVRS